MGGLYGLFLLPVLLILGVFKRELRGFLGICLLFAGGVGMLGGLTLPDAVWLVGSVPMLAYGLWCVKNCD